MDIKEKLYELGLPEEYATGSFAVTINMIDLEEAKKIGRYLFAYGVRLTKASEMKYYLCSEDEIRKILTRIQYCQDNNIDYIDENQNNKDFIFNEESFNETFNNPSLSNIIPYIFKDQEMINKEMLNILDSNVVVGLTEENYDRYVALEAKLTNVMQCLNGTGEISPEVTNNLIKLISVNAEYNDQEILLAALIYNRNFNANEIENIENAINQVILHSFNQGGSLNL